MAITRASDRFQFALEYRQISQSDLSRIAKISRGRISQIINDDGLPSSESLFAIADALQFEARWLVTGLGPRTWEEKEDQSVDASGLSEVQKKALLAVRNSFLADN